MDKLEQRVVDLEARLALVEHALALSKQSSDAALPHSSDEVAADRVYSMIKVDISNKRYDVANPSLGSYEDHIWFDCLYTATGLSKATRAVKGALEFADHFGDVKFRVNITVNDTINLGYPLSQKGIGFTYNQFMLDHQWMLATKVQDMKCTFRLTNVLYMDGTSESFV